MGAQNGKDLLVKVDMTGDGQFETVAGLRATRISFNAESVDADARRFPVPGAGASCWVGRVSNPPPSLARACFGTRARMSARARSSSMEKRPIFSLSSLISVWSRAPFRSRAWIMQAAIMAKPHSSCRWRRPGN